VEQKYAIEFLLGRPLGPEELEMIRQQIEECFDDIDDGSAASSSRQFDIARDFEFEVDAADRNDRAGRQSGAARAHPSRQALSFNSPRLIQLFIVPSGTLMR